jgi:hypothetical protein
MSKLWGRFTSLMVPLLTLLALVVLFGLYQRYYVASREAYLTEHGFRVLAAVGRQLDAYIDSITKTVEGAKGDGVADRPAYLKHFLARLLPHLGMRDLCFAARGASSSCPEQITDNTFSLQFGSEPPALFQRAFEKFPIAGRVRVDSGLRDRLNFFSDDYFDDVLIADTHGRVLFQKSQDNRIVTLARVVAASTHAEASQQSGAGGSSGGLQQTADSVAASWDRFSASSNVVDVKVAGESYRLFLEPFQLSADGRPKEPLVLCGLWRTERLSSDSFAMPYSYVIWFVLTCIAAGCFLWPFLKINYMGRTERLRQRDGWLLVFSIFLGTTAVTLLILNGAHASQAQFEIDTSLQTIATRIQQNVDSEVTAALRQLATMSATHPVAQLAEKWDPTTNILSTDKTVEAYPYFDFVFWLDRLGRQKVKFTSDDIATPQTSLGEYRFFKDANGNGTDGNASDRLIPLHQPVCWPDPNGSTADPSSQSVCIDKYSLQATISPNTGRLYTVLAAPFRNGGVTVQALATQPLSLVDPVLPPNVGFAVLEDDGTVLFHSNALRDLSENFIEECKDSSLVRAALFSQSPQTLDLVYSGVDRRALLTKVTGLSFDPLTLVVFQNVDIDRTIELAIVLIVAVLMGLYGVVILIIAGIDGLRRSPYPPQWLWPIPENADRYALILAANTLLVVIFLATYVRLWELGLLGFTVSVVVVGLVLTYVLATKPTAGWPVQWHRRLEAHFVSIYVVAAVSLLAVSTMVPTFGFFKFAHDAASELATKHEQLSLLVKRLDREARIRVYSLRSGKAPFVDARRSSTLDRYDTLPLGPFIYDPCTASESDTKTERVKRAAVCEESNNVSKSPEEEDWQHGFDDVLARAVRFLPANQLGTEMRMLPFESNSKLGPHAQFVELHDETFWATLNNDEHVDAAFTPWPDADLGGSWMWIVLIMFLVGCWVTMVTKQIFLAGNKSFLPFGTVDLRTSDDITTNALVLHGPWPGVTSPLAGISGTDYIDLRLGSTNALSRLSNRSGAVVLDHFEFDSNNRWSNLARLQLLERLVYKEGRCVIIGSPVDPVSHLSESEFGILAEDAQSAAELLGRWRLVMTSFQPLMLKDPNEEAFQSQFKLVHEGGATVERLVQWVKEECDHTPYLRQLGRSLLAKVKSGEADSEALDALRQEGEARVHCYYQALWSTFTRNERLVLYQLGRDGWANPNNDAAIRRLRRKGILCLKPMLRIMNESLREFANKAQDQNEIAEWERQGKESSWRTVKVSLLTVGVALAAWLLYAQKDLFQTAIGYIVALGAALTAISNLFGTFKGRIGGAPKAPDAAV